MTTTRTPEAREAKATTAANLRDAMEWLGDYFSHGSEGDNMDPLERQILDAMHDAWKLLALPVSREETPADTKQAEGIPVALLLSAPCTHAVLNDRHDRICTRCGVKVPLDHQRAFRQFEAEPPAPAREETPAEEELTDEQLAELRADFATFVEQREAPRKALKRAWEIIEHISNADFIEAGVADITRERWDAEQLLKAFPAPASAPPSVPQPRACLAHDPYDPTCRACRRASSDAGLPTVTPEDPRA